VSVVKLGGSRNKLDMHKMRDIRTSGIKINKTSHTMTIASMIRERRTISGAKLNIKLHRSLNCAMISERSMTKKIMDILFLG